MKSDIWLENQIVFINEQKRKGNIKIMNQNQQQIQQNNNIQYKEDYQRFQELIDKSSVQSFLNKFKFIKKLQTIDPLKQYGDYLNNIASMICSFTKEKQFVFYAFCIRFAKFNLRNYQIDKIQQITNVINKINHIYEISEGKSKLRKNTYIKIQSEYEDKQINDYFIEVQNYILSFLSQLQEKKEIVVVSEKVFEEFEKFQKQSKEYESLIKKYKKLAIKNDEQSFNVIEKIKEEIIKQFGGIQYQFQENKEKRPKCTQNKKLLWIRCLLQMMSYNCPQEFQPHNFNQFNGDTDQSLQLFNINDSVLNSQDENHMEIEQVNQQNQKEQLTETQRKESKINDKVFRGYVKQ
ncbi:unnamed protein product [Paramecium sonneborni]|uniref:Uncharacterized protein n=1 Tax=Paramecium sonneborni TaxID=65129 RepID=A0A8S1M831_9CILI|nr:unnamed protein product [Paramecium sonneborni]